MSDTEFTSAATLRRQVLILHANHVLPPGSEEALTVPTGNIFDGDVIASPASRLIPRGVAMSNCTLRFSQGLAALAALNTTGEPILLRKGTAVASVLDREPLSIVSNTITPWCMRNSAPSAVLPSIATTVSPDLTVEQTVQLLAVLKKHSGSFDVTSNTLKPPRIRLKQTAPQLYAVVHSEYLRINVKL